MGPVFVPCLAAVLAQLCVPPVPPCLGSGPLRSCYYLSDSLSLCVANSRPWSPCPRCVTGNYSRRLASTVGRARPVRRGCSGAISGTTRQPVVVPCVVLCVSRPRSNECMTGLYLYRQSFAGGSYLRNNIDNKRLLGGSQRHPVVVPFYAMLCRAMLCCDVMCPAVLCRAVPYSRADCVESTHLKIFEIRAKKLI